ncbi:MAG TPA: inositol monophosphatase [Nitrospirae bacterium]|nr:inositol monophosphatase [Nitrospirota bacterium]
MADNFLATARRAAKSAGQFIIDNLGSVSKKDISVKQASDFVTRVDRDSEQLILNTIREIYPGHYFLTEESVKDPETDEYRWIIDPLDGTTNFIHGYPVFSVSIALQYKQETVLGVILDPCRNELYHAEKGKGAFLNDSPIKVSHISGLSESLIATGFPFRQKNLIDKYLELFKNIFNKVSDIRRAGSAALDLAHLAAGRCDGFFEIGLSPWDIAAGSLIIEQAGGVVSDFAGGSEYLLTGNIIAGSPTVHNVLAQEVKQVFRDILPK